MVKREKREKIEKKEKRKERERKWAFYRLKNHPSIFV